METTQERKTCAELIESELADREAELVRLFNIADNCEDMAEQDDAWQSIQNMDYGLDVRKVIRVVWSGGGPSDEIEITCDNLGNILEVEYVYKDWFDGARVRVEEDSAVYRYASMILEGLSS